MADIKTREVNRGSIKSLDRASSSMHCMKAVAVKSKTLEMMTRQESEQGSSYATDRAENYVEGGATYAAEAGRDLLQQGYHKAQGIAGNRQKAPPVEGHASEAQVAEALKRQGTKDLMEKRVRSGRASRSLKNATGRAASVENPGTPVKARGAFIAGNQQKSHSAATNEFSARKRLAMSRILNERRNRQSLIYLIRHGNTGRDGAKVAKTSGGLFRLLGRGADSAVSALGIGGSVAALIVIIMILFGAGLLMTDDGGYVTGTGDMTIVEVARGELGNVGGDKFWKWYGFTSHVDWCAIFCSWCGEQCGYIKAGITPKFAIVGDGASWFKIRHRWSGRGYRPGPGDFIFFDYERDGILDHVGIVESCDGKTVTTIEGNSGNACRRNSYTVGSSMIAGYGIMIQQGGNKGRLIALKATQLAYPDSPDESKYHGGKPTAAYAAALERAYPNRSGWGKPSRDGASCDVFVGVCIVDSGVDREFPRGYRDQAKRLDSRTDLYECIASITSGSIPESILKDGDIIRYDKSNGGVHICIYVDGKIKQAGHDNFYPRTNSIGNKLSISGKKLIRVYRAK